MRAAQTGRKGLYYVLVMLSEFGVLAGLALLEASPKVFRELVRYIPRPKSLLEVLFFGVFGGVVSLFIAGWVFILGLGVYLLLGQLAGFLAAVALPKPDENVRPRISL